jgi:hypothetical protein
MRVLLNIFSNHSGMLDFSDLALLIGQWQLAGSLKGKSKKGVSRLERTLKK